jgi:hypothetical protein
MKVVDIATEIYINKGEPTDTSVAAIAYWVRANIGKLNSLIYSCFTINTSLEIVDEDGNEINIDAAAILKQMWEVDRYDTLINNQVTSLGTDDIIEYSEGGSTIRKTNKNEVIKSFRSLKEEEGKELSDLIARYNMKGASPRQVAGDDTEIGTLPS